MVFFHRPKAEVSAATPEFARAPTTPEVKAAVTAEVLEPNFPVRYPQEIKQTAPMFIKVEKYREILTELDEIKTFTASINQIFSVLADIDATREDAMKALRASLQRLERATAMIDAELLRPIGFEVFPHGEVELKHIETSLSALQQQLAGMRRELEKMYE